MNDFIEKIQKAYNEGDIFTAFDLETTGLDPKTDKIVEIGAVKFDNKGLIARFSTLINPGIPMPKEAERVNNISDKMLKDKPAINGVFPDFLRFIQGTILLAHNTSFDCNFINEKLKEFPSSPFPALPNRIVDTLLLSREVFPAFQSHSLQNLASALQINAIDAHRAEDDARLCMEIFIRCIKARGV
ncbi:MAG: 3'-5' exonuclease [Treponema sp.]|nr:3'-5' exonuclease [Treponema sp.]